MTDSVDLEQDRQIAYLTEAMKRSAMVLEALGVIPDDDIMIPTELREPHYPIQFIDRANCPPYLLAGKMVEWKHGHWYDVDCPDPPFNPYWGLKGHPMEKIGIDLYVPADHDGYLHTTSDGRGDLHTETERAARAVEVKAASPIPNEEGFSEREVI